MYNGVDLASAYKGSVVFLTGHTGFKGAWLVAWLKRLGATVHGYALDPTPAQSPLFSVVEAELAGDCREDIRNLAAVRQAMAAAKPTLLFHMAAQPIVSVGYDDPVATFDVNVMGTVNVLEAARSVPSLKAVVSVTSDKCYENKEVIFPYREDDHLGGKDPYSASKGAAEIVTHSYRRSYFSDLGTPLVASGRAGNVIGGGDFAKDRIVPDLMRAMAAGEPLVVRNPDATRPWQHVLEPIGGYLTLGAMLLQGRRDLADSWNFGPATASHVPVRGLLDAFGRNLGARMPIITAPERQMVKAEASLLSLDITKARLRLGWSPQLSFDETVAWTADWYLAHTDRTDPRQVMLAQIEEYHRRLATHLAAA